MGCAWGGGLGAGSLPWQVQYPLLPNAPAWAVSGEGGVSPLMGIALVPITRKLIIRVRPAPNSAAPHSCRAAAACPAPQPQGADVWCLMSSPRLLAGVFVNMIHGCIVASTERSEHLSISGQPAAWQLAPLASPRAPCTLPPPQDSASPWGPWAWTQLPFASAEPGWKSEATLHTASGTVSQKAFEEDPQSPGPDWATGSREQGMTRGRQHPSRPPLSPCVPPSSWWKGAKTPPGGSVGKHRLRR